MNEVIKNANHELKGFIGSENAYKHPLFGMKYTDGVKYAAEKFQCYWFLDVICSYQYMKSMQSEEFQTWKLIKQEDGSFQVIATDGNENILAKQQIPFSDFPYDEFTIYNVNSMMLLPSEY